MKPGSQLWVLVGGNGAGKSTFYETALKPLNFPFVNADVLAKRLSPDSPEAESYKAARLAAEQRSRLLRDKKSFCFETVFSHPSKIDFIAEAKAHGYEVVLVYIHLFDSSLNEARVSSRIKVGGHAVPPEKIHARIPRTMKHISLALPLVDTFIAYDNSSSECPFQKILLIQQGKLVFSVDDIPDWASHIIAGDL